VPFGVKIGGTDLAKAYVGSTPVKRIYAGSTHVWPPISTPIVWVGSTVASGTTNSFPAHLAGDLLVAAAISSTSTARTPPAGYTTVYTSTSGFAAFTLAYKWATAAGTQFGTWPSGTAWTCSYAFRGADTGTPFGKVDSVVVEGAKSGTAPALTLTDPSGDSLVGLMFFNSGTSGVWGPVPGGAISKNMNARLSNLQQIDTEVSVSDAAMMTHTTGPVTFRTASFELLVPAPVTYNGLYGVRVEYLDNYEVKFTALTSYAADPEEAFFFRSTPISRDGYTGRTFSKTFQASAVPMDCVLEEYWATPSGVRNTINFRVSPRSVGNGVVEEIIP
jgi:hypothetical protein